MRVVVSVDIPAARSQVWQSVSDIASHVTWMRDAVDIRFEGDKRRQVGTEFVCDTKIGPLRTSDRMLVTEWEDECSLGIQHKGIVSGVGTMTLDVLSPHSTKVTWEENLSLPLRFGGRIGELVAKPLLGRLWQGNLKRLSAKFDRPDAV